MEQRQKIPLLWFNWLVLVVLGVMLFGIGMILAPGLIRQAFSLLLYAAPDAIDSDFGVTEVAYITLLHGVLGTVMFGWGVALLLILRGPFSRGRREAWNIFCISVAAWFLPHTLFSLWTGFWQNAVLNSVIALLFVIPLAATYKVFKHQNV